VGYFEKVTVDMTSCYEHEEEEDRKEERQDKPPNDEDKTLTIIEANQHT